MSEVKFYNVGHGDFGIYVNHNRKYACVLDCGSSDFNRVITTGRCKMPYVGHYDCDNSFYYDCNTKMHSLSIMPSNLIYNTFKYYMNNSPVKENMDCLISHFHADHYNGLNATREALGTSLPFQRMYIPYMRPEVTNNTNFFKFCLLNEYIADILSLKRVTNFRHLFSDPYAYDIQMVGYGDIIPNLIDSAGAVANILWPRKDIKLLPDIVTEDIDKLMDLFNKLRKKYDLYSNIDIDAQASQLIEKVSPLEQTSSEITKNQDSMGYKINEDNTSNEPYDMNIDNQDFGKLGSEQQRLLQSSNAKITRYLNNISIVFKLSNKLLWCGDIDERVVNSIAYHITSNMDVIKLPHHGTVDISSINYSFDLYVNSISFQENKDTYVPPDYENLYKASKERSIIVCTNGHAKCRNFLFNKTNCLCSNEIHISL